MSSKFTRQSGVQGTPPVCKKPPDDPVSPPPPIAERVLMAFVNMFRIGTPGFYVNTILDLYPVPGFPNWWSGTSGTLPDWVDMTMIYDVSSQTLSISIQPYDNGVPLTAVTFNDVPVISTDPFATNLIHTIPRSSSQHNEVQIYQ